jgi:hypothetical protein
MENLTFGEMMKVLKIGILVGLMAFLPIAIAQSDAEKEVEILLEMMGLETAMDQSISVLLDAQINQNPELAPLKSVMMEFFRKHMSLESLKPDLIKIYTETYSVTELRVINAFYATDTGKKTIKTMPELMAKAAQLGATRMQENIGELQEMIRVETERLNNLQQQ